MKSTYIELAKELISIPSISGDIPQVNKAVEIAKKYLSDYELQSFIAEDTPSVLFTTKTQAKKLKIILHAHVDIVIGEKEEFTPYEKNGRIYGRGAHDTKAATAVMLTVFKELSNSFHTL
jgi:succinyl-diaminopimelate desuccinylase